MTKLSRISRSIIVVIFVAFMVFMEYQNIIINVSNIEEFTPVDFDKVPGWLKVIYVISVIALVILYLYIKERLYKKKVKRIVSLTIRYIYLVIIGGIVSFITIRQIIQGLQFFDKCMLVALSVITGILVKKIIFNVSKSDILSVIGMLMYVFIIDTLSIAEIYTSKLICLFVAATIFVMQIVVDEIKQRGIKNRKYLICSLILGVCMGISIVTGVHYSVYVSLAILIFFIGSNLDNAHITFPRKAMEDISKEKREFLYKIERINISKLLISVLVTAFTAIVIVASLRGIIEHTAISSTDNVIISSIVSSSRTGVTFAYNFDITNFITNIRNLIIMSKTYYFLIILYILFMEVLAFLLKRRYDTKSTAMKIIIMAMLMSITTFGLNISIYHQVITMSLIMIAIVNTSNIYLNREERIKLLVA